MEECAEGRRGGGESGEMMCECGGGEGVGAGGGNVAEGAEDELALEHEGMRDCEMGRLENEVVVEEDVEID